MLGQYPLDESRIVGGIEAIMVPLVRALGALDDLDLHVITCQPSAEEGERRTSSGVPLHVLRRKRLGRATLHARDVAHLARTIARLAPDVVHAQGVGIYAAAAMASSLPYVVTVHGLVFRELESAVGIGPRVRTTIDSLYERYLLSRLNHLISISPYVEAELGQRRGCRIDRIENSIDECFFRLSDDIQAGSVLYAGRVIRRKGLLELLHALGPVSRVVPDVSLRIAGEHESEPDYVSECRAAIAQLGLEDRVTFLGSLTMDEMAAEYARCAVFALPSRQETAPVVVAEAMAAGRPVVATRACGMPYMVEHEQSGYLVDYTDTAGWSAAITRLLQCPELRQAMGQRGRLLAQQRFAPQVIACKTHRLYREKATEGAR